MATHHIVLLPAPDGFRIYLDWEPGRPPRYVHTVRRPDQLAHELAHLPSAVVILVHDLILDGWADAILQHNDLLHLHYDWLDGVPIGPTSRCAAAAAHIARLHLSHPPERRYRQPDFDDF